MSDFITNAELRIEAERLCDENERLEAENAKLWELGEQYETVLADYRSEVAKLRELCERMHRHIRQTCGECDGWYCSNFDEDNECCVYDTLARELGVEVPDGD